MRDVAAISGIGLLPVVVENLNYRRAGATLIDIDHLEIQERHPTVILGPNGAGKSLLLRLLHGLVEPDAGRITFAGRPLSKEICRRQAMVFQSPVLLRRTVLSNVTFVLKSLPPRQRKIRALDLLQNGGLKGMDRRSARTLSGGEKQRLAIVRAMATQPDILFLDEPTSNLDPAATLAIEEMIQSASASGIKVILVTHDVGQAERLAADVVFCHRGKVLEHDAADKFFAGPRSPEAADFISGKLVL